MSRFRSALLLLSLTTGVFAQGAGSVTGFILNLGTGDTVPGVTVTVTGVRTFVTTDLDGMFSVDLPPGTYEFTVHHPGFQPMVIKAVKVSPGEVTIQDFPLNPTSGVASTEVDVVATAERASVQALLSERKSSSVLLDSIGAKEMKGLPGSDASDMMQRVTGVSIVGDKYVFVRGLGERYSATQLNGTQLASPQPDKKVIPMDLFPTDLLENIETAKSYLPDQSGEFAGGVVKVNTIDFPDEALLSVSYGTGFDTNTSFSPFLSYPGGGRDFWGFDDGTRALPSIIPADKIVKATRFTPGFSAEEVQAFGRSFANVWEPEGGRDARLPQKFSIVGGNTFGPVGMVLAFNHVNSLTTSTEERTFYRVENDGLTAFNDYDFDIGTVSTRTGATANFGFRLSDNNQIRFRNFYAHDSSDESRFFEGFNSDVGQDILNTRLRFVEESLYSGQLSGEHYVPVFGGSLIEWDVSRSRSTLDEPDIRETLYEFRPSLDAFALADESQSGSRQFTGLADVVWEPKFSWTTFFYSGGLSGSIKVGALYRDRERDFASRRFRLTPASTAGIDITQAPEDILIPGNIRPSAFELREETRNTDAYDAHQINRSFFAMGDIAFSKIRIIGGARLETDSQRVTTFDPFAPDAALVSTDLRNQDLLPAISLVYNLKPDMNIRGSFSKTLNRPEFRELAPFDFTDVVGGRSVIGYPDLLQATIWNYDLRWEWFPTPLGLVSTSFFYKDFENPIERVVEATAQLRTSYRNAKSARNLGIELDFRRDLAFINSSLRNFNINTNYTWVNSEVDIGEQTGGVNLTSLSRPLAGQSANLFNFIFEWTNPKSATAARALVSYRGRRIIDVGSFGLPDIYEEGLPKLDAVFSQDFGPSDRFNLKVTASNLLNRKIEFTQGGLPFRVYDNGRQISVSISYSFFKRERP